jgi:hypothetical protein
MGIGLRKRDSGSVLPRKKRRKQKPGGSSGQRPRWPREAVISLVLVLVLVLEDQDRPLEEIK